MDPALFDESPGEIEHNAVGDPFYVPPEIPREIDLDADLTSALVDASRALAQLKGLRDLIPNPHLLIGPYLRREAVSSSQIEGTRASLSDVFVEEADPKGAPYDADRRDLEEVMNYIQAVEHGLEKIESGDIDVALIKELHSILLSGVRGQDKDPGEFRDDPVWIGGPARPDAKYVPPEPGFIEARIADVAQYMENPPDLDPLIRIGLLHYQVEAIHPFRDGNGRMGRLLITLSLIEEGLIPGPLLYLSAYFNQDRDQYYRHLEAVDRRGDYKGWLRYFLRGVETQSRDAAERANELVSLREEYRHQLEEEGATPATFQTLDLLFTNPYITITQAAELLDVAYPTAQRAIENYLVDAGILEEITGKQRNRQWVFEDVLQILELS